MYLIQTFAELEKEFEGHHNFLIDHKEAIKSNYITRICSHCKKICQEHEKLIGITEIFKVGKGRRLQAVCHSSYCDTRFKIDVLLNGRFFK